MKVLLVNNNHKMVGGTERYYLSLAKLLRDHGHKVAFFSTHSKNNLKSKWSKYFVDPIYLGPGNFIQKVMKVPYSFDSKRKIAKLLNDFRPDIVHINNIYYQISPSILGEIKKRKIPIVQTVHDYQLISPIPALFYNGRVCEITKKNKYYLALSNRNSGSYIATAISVVSQYIQHFFRFYEKSVDVFITPSKFMKNKLHEYGFKAKKIIHLPNFIYAPKEKFRHSPNKKEKYILYFGRLDEPKGVLFLLKVIERIPSFNFKIIGNFTNNESESNITKYLKEHHLKNILIEPYKKDLKKDIVNSYFVIVPSLWYENQPYSILESMALGKTVLASKIGGISELVNNGNNAFLFNPGDINDCIKKINYLISNPSIVKNAGKKAQQQAHYFDSEKYYKELINIYTELLGPRNSSSFLK